MKTKILLLLSLFSIAMSMEIKAAEAYAVIADSTMTLYYDDFKSTRSGNIFTTELNRIYEFNSVARYTPSWYKSAYKNSVKTIVFDVSFAAARPISTYCWFSSMKNLTSIRNMQYLNTSNTTEMSDMFSFNPKLTSLDLSYFNTSNATSIWRMFGSCTGLKHLDLSHFDTSKVTSMAALCDRCYSLESIDVSSFNTSNVKYFYAMFYDCRNLMKLDLSNFDTSKATQSYTIAQYCDSLKELRISSTMGNLSSNAWKGLGSASSPCSIFAPEDFNFGVDTSGSYFNWKGGYFKLGKEEAPKEAYAVLTDDEYSGGKRLSFYYDSEKSSHVEGTVYSLNEGANFPDWNTEETAASITSVGYHCDFEDARPTSGYCWFYEMGNLERIDDGQFLNTSEMTNMAGMFFYCSKLSYIGAYNFDTSKATNMWAMFYGCSALEELDVSGFNTSNVTDMTGMFCYCSSLTSLDLSSFDTSKSTSFNGMFYGCSGLTGLNLGGFDISSATDTQNMLAYCTGLKELTVSLSMQDLADGACAGIGTAASPCTIYAPAGFNFGVSTTGSYFQWKGGYFKLGAQTALLGDVNASGSVTLADAICEISWLLEQNPPVFVEAVADYNQDNVVSASDAIAIIQYVATVEPSPINPDVPDPDVTKILDELGLLRPTLNGFDLPLADLRGYTAFTMDVTLPDGETLASAKLGTHSVAVNPLGANRYRIVAWSMDMAEIGSGTTLHCTTTGGSPASAIINNIRIVDLQTGEHGARAVKCTPDGIHYMDKAPDTSSPRYRIDGTRIATPHRGIVIENGRKVVVRQ